MEEPCGAAPSAAPNDSRPAPLHAAQSKRTTPEHSLHEIQITSGGIAGGALRGVRSRQPHALSLTGMAGGRACGAAQLCAPRACTCVVEVAAGGQRRGWAADGR
jgi:hypothetical protein